MWDAFDTRNESKRKHRLTGKKADGEAWKIKRRQVSKEFRKGKKVSAHRGLRDKTAHSKSMWQGVKTHLGWDSTGAPKRLIRQTERDTGNTIEVIKEPGQEESVKRSPKLSKQRRRKCRNRLAELRETI